MDLVEGEQAKGRGDSEGELHARESRGVRAWCLPVHGPIWDCPYLGLPNLGLTNLGPLVSQLSDLECVIVMCCCRYAWRPQSLPRCGFGRSHVDHMPPAR